jgi:hypothetical protein
MTPSLPTDSEVRRLRVRGQLAAHVRWTLTKTVAGDFALAAATSHLIWLSELHISPRSSSRLKSVPKSPVQRALIASVSCPRLRQKPYGKRRASRSGRPASPTIAEAQDNKPHLARKPKSGGRRETLQCLPDTPGGRSSGRAKRYVRTRLTDGESHKGRQDVCP